MKANPKKEISLRFPWIQVQLLPLIVLLLLPGGGMMLGGIWFWLILLLSFFLIWSLLEVPADEGETAVETEPRMLSEPEQTEAIREAMNVQITTEEAGVRVFRGGL